MQNPIDSAVAKILEWNKRWPKSAILWSGGKDSTALLHLIKFKAGLDLPVVQYREPAFRERYEYSDKLIKDWNLVMYDYPSNRYGLTDGVDVNTGEIRFDILKYQQWGGSCIVISLGTERPVGDEKYLCGVDFFQRPTGTFNWPWEGVYIGTKGHDTDPIKGEVVLETDVRFVEKAPVSLYPLRDWSDGDVFEYLESQGVEPDPNRYEKGGEEWRHKIDKSMNADYIPTCLNCIDRHQGPYVHCPKLNARVNNISKDSMYQDTVIPDLGFKPAWDSMGQPKKIAQ